MALTHESFRPVDAAYDVLGGDELLEVDLGHDDHGAVCPRRQRRCDRAEQPVGEASGTAARAHDDPGDFLRAPEEHRPRIVGFERRLHVDAGPGDLGPGRLDDLASGVFAQPALAPLPRVAGNLVAADDVEYGIASFGLMSGPNECVVRGGGTIDATHNHVVMLESHDPYLRLSVSRRIIVDVSPLLKICSRVSRTATGRQASHRMDESGSNGAPDAGDVA